MVGDNLMDKDIKKLFARDTQREREREREIELSAKQNQ